MKHCLVIVALMATSACHGPLIKEAQSDGGAGHGGGSGKGGASGRGGGSGAVGTGGAVAGTAGAGAGSGGLGGIAGSVGTGGASGTVGTGGTGTGIGGAGTGTGGSGAGGSTVGTGGSTVGTGGSTAGRGGSGGTGGTTVNACDRCDTRCKDGVCDLAVVRTSTSLVDSSATAVALNDGRLYFMEGSSATGSGIHILSIATGGGPEMELYPYHDCSNCTLSLAVDGTDVIFAGQNIAGINTIQAVPKAGGGSVRNVCTTQAFPLALALDGDSVYYVRSDTGIERCPKAGGTTSHVFSVGSGASPNIVIRMSSRPGAVVWGDRDTGVVTRIDTNMQTGKVVGISLNNSVYPGGVCDAVDDGTTAFWVLCGWPYTAYTQGATVNSPKTLGSAFGSGDPNAIFDQYGSVGVDGNYVYFTEAGFLDRVPKTGGSVEARANLTDGSGNFIKALIVGFDTTYVYLARASTGDGGIYRVAK